MKKLDWGLLYAKKSPAEKEYAKSHKEPKPAVASRYMGLLIAAGSFLALILLIVFLIAFHNADTVTQMKAMVVFVFLTTVIYGAGLYFALGALGKKALAMKQAEEKAKAGQTGKNEQKRR